jgi:hypothetical protein
MFRSFQPRGVTLKNLGLGHVSLRLSVCSLCLFLSRGARADDSPLGLSVSLERVAGVAYGSARVDAASDSFSATAFGIAGPAINPVNFPRAAADVLLPSGLTLGGAVGYSGASLSISPDGGTSSSITGNAWLVVPRVGYLLHLGSLVDLWPRVGITLEGAGLQSPESQTCSSVTSNSGPTPVVTQTCTNSPGPSYSLFYAAASVDLAAALRVTRSFNVLGGIAYDQVFAGSGSSTQNGTTTPIQAGGQLFGVSLWFGLGGYVW